jgi:pimeloyl-ACP methyl ester carboxylesterase
VQHGVASIDAATLTAAPVAYRPGPMDEAIRARSDDGSEVVAYDFGGEGEDLLLAHATGFHAHLWLPVVEGLRDHFHCYAFDARGHGASGTPASGDFDWRRSGDDARAAAAALGLKRPLAAGHSGGAAALILAEADHPGSWTALWLYEPVVPDWSSFPGGNPLVDGALRRRDRFASRDDARRNFNGKPPFDCFTPNALNLYVDHGFIDDPGGGVVLACRREDEAATYAGSVPANPRGRLGEVHVPVHVACGERGDHLSPGTMGDAVRLLPDGELEIISGVGHFGPFEDPAGIARSITAALA